MSPEIAVILVLLYIGWTLERIFKAIVAVEVELSTSRWERGKRAVERQRGAA